MATLANKRERERERESVWDSCMCGESGIRQARLQPHQPAREKAEVTHQRIVRGVGPADVEVMIKDEERIAPANAEVDHQKVNNKRLGLANVK